MARPFLPGPGRPHDDAPGCNYGRAAAGCPYIHWSGFVLSRPTQSHETRSVSVPESDQSHIFANADDPTSAGRLVVSAVLTGPDDTGGLLSRPDLAAHTAPGQSAARGRAAADTNAELPAKLAASGASLSTDTSPIPSIHTTPAPSRDDKADDADASARRPAAFLGAGPPSPQGIPGASASFPGG